MLAILMAGLIGQTFQVSPSFTVTPETAKRTYADAYHAAHNGNRPLVIFIDCPLPKLLSRPSYVVYECSAAEWFEMTKTVERGVLISVGGWRHKLLPADATAEQIGLEVFRATAPVRPLRSRTQINWSLSAGTEGRVEALQRVSFPTSIARGNC